MALTIHSGQGDSPWRPRFGVLQQLLDEATANVDSYTEFEIQRALKRLLEGRTAIVIAHRLATIRGADRILVLDGGEVVEQGRHEDLVERGGLYAQLWRVQTGEQGEPAGSR